MIPFSPGERRVLGVASPSQQQALGVGFSWGLTWVSGWHAPVSGTAIGGGFLFSAAVGTSKEGRGALPPRPPLRAAALRTPNLSNGFRGQSPWPFFSHGTD